MKNENVIIFGILVFAIAIIFLVVIGIYLFSESRKIEKEYVKIKTKLKQGKTPIDENEFSISHVKYSRVFDSGNLRLIKRNNIAKHITARYHSFFELR